MPTMQAWENLIAEYKLDIEVTKFNINNKSFDATRHPAEIPVCYWRD
jgi:hypothetical protein